MSERRFFLLLLVWLACGVAATSIGLCFSAQGFLKVGFVLLLLLFFTCPVEIWFGALVLLARFFAKAGRMAVCRLRGHDFEPDLIQLKVVELPKEPQMLPPTTAYRRPADDPEPSLGLVVSKRRLCRRCQNDVLPGTQQP